MSNESDKRVGETVKLAEDRWKRLSESLTTLISPPETCFNDPVSCMIIICKELDMETEKLELRLSTLLSLTNSLFDYTPQQIEQRLIPYTQAKQQAIAEYMLLGTMRGIATSIFNSLSAVIKEAKEKYRGDALSWDREKELLIIDGYRKFYEILTIDAAGIYLANIETTLMDSQNALSVLTGYMTGANTTQAYDAGLKSPALGEALYLSHSEIPKTVAYRIEALGAVGEETANIRDKDNFVIWNTPEAVQAIYTLRRNLEESVKKPYLLDRASRRQSKILPESDSYSTDECIVNALLKQRFIEIISQLKKELHRKILETYLADSDLHAHGKQIEIAKRFNMSPALFSHHRKMAFEAASKLLGTALSEDQKY